MGIFDALTTAVGGMQAQAFALQNISGNIANSQTTGYKGIDTSFEDLIQEGAPSQQSAGGVIASASPTNSVQGAIQTASVGTYMAINGTGYFAVEQPSNFSDGAPVFNGVDSYTRRGDFQSNSSGYLVNGAGYYLMGIPLDPTTGNPVGSAPQVLQFQNNFLAAQPTTEIDYRANLASYPLTPDASTSQPGSELLNPADFIANPLAVPPQSAVITGQGAALLPDAAADGVGTVSGLVGGPTGTTLASLGIATGQIVTVSDGSNTDTFTAGAASTVQDLLDAINGGTADVTAALDSSGHIELTSGNLLDAVTVGGNGAAAVGFDVGDNTFQPVNLLTQGAVAQGQTLTVTVGSNATQTITFGSGGAPAEVATLQDLQTALSGLTNTNGNSIDANGNVSIVAANPTDSITLGGTVASTNETLNFGIHTLSALPSNETVVANDETTFLNQSISGGAVTGFDSFGSPVNVQLRWAKTDSASLGAGHTDSWNLFYQSDSSATGTQTAWQNVGTTFTFDANGQMNPPISNLTLNNLSVDGDNLGTVSLVFGSGGLTQFSDPNGVAQVNELQQNGYAAGSLQAISVDTQGQLVGSYSNGRTLALANITLANFNDPNALNRIDGGAFTVSADSGPPIYNASGSIVASSLESSNVDIATEFSKLIVTQQAYSANTRVITTANQMVQDLLNMLR